MYLIYWVLRYVYMADEPRHIIHTSEGILSLRPSRIVLLKAAGSSCTFTMKDDTRHTVSGPLKEHLAALQLLGNFCRVHRSHAVNLRYVKGTDRSKGLILLKYDMQVHYTATYLQGFLTGLEQMGTEPEEPDSEAEDPLSEID